MRSFILTILAAIIISGGLHAQTLGGNSIFNFLRVSNAPKLTALGGVNLSHSAPQVGMAFQNPALLRQEMDQQFHLAFNDFYSGISIFSTSYSFYQKDWNTSFSSGLQYFNYGKTPATDASGNVLGLFRAADMVFQVSAARSYLDRWNYGISLKFVSSGYESYKANGVAMDLGILYKDSSGGFRASVVMKNAGMELKKYREGSAEEIPFEMQAGISQRLKGSPFIFSLTAQQLHRFNIRYKDTSFNLANGQQADKGTGTGKIMDHLVLGATVQFNDRLAIDLGYNFLRRRELNLGNAGNGLNGFSYGLELKLKKFIFHFARANYQSNTATNQVGLTLDMSQFW